jgi:hypothetical protein
MRVEWRIAAGLAVLAGTAAVGAAQDAAGVLEKIDAAAQSRFAHVQGFSDTEHYAVYRGADQAHPAAEMTVRVTFRKGAGKNYKVLSQSGSALIQRLGLKPLIENEQEINDPAKVEQSWFTTANFEMQVKPGETRTLEGRACVGVAINARRKAPNMIDGMLWVDPQDGEILEVEGIASKRPSALAGTTKMMRLYRVMEGYAMATHARAESRGWLGRTVVTVDYSDYTFEMK